MDKEAEAVPAWEALGFGFTELGAVTRHPQPGNPQPRVFRAVADEAIVNRMGFNNPGAEAVAERLVFWRRAGRWPAHPVGINLGKSKVTPIEKAPEDYAFSFHVLWSHADFFVVNVSSPNTPNLRQLQDKAALDEILAALQEVNRQAAGENSRRSNETNQQGNAHGLDQGGIVLAAKLAPKPLLVKVAPDLTFDALDDILGLAQARSLAGIVATNTTVGRPETPDERARQAYSETGGLSGKPLRARSTEVIRHLYRQTRGALPIVGVGGIFSAEDAWEKITAGAALVQVYTGLVYEGPGLPKSIVAGLRQRLEEAGLSDLRRAVGLET
jgi:dihydroorotate dehydrogenase